MLLSLYGLFTGRYQCLLLWRAKGTISYIACLNVVLIVFSVLSAFTNHNTLIGQSCAIPMPLRIDCSAYTPESYRAMDIVNGVWNAILVMTMNLLCAARWKQMKQNVPFNEKLRVGINTLGIVLCILKIVAQIQSTLGPEGNEANTAMNAGISAAYVVLSVLFDITICMLIARALFKARIGVHQQDNMLNSRFTRFKVALCLLVIIDFLTIGVTLGLIQVAQYTASAVGIAVAMTVIHVFISKELLKDFVDGMLEKNVQKASRPQTGGASSSDQRRDPQLSP